MKDKLIHSDVRVTSKGDNIKLAQSTNQYGSNVLQSVELNKAQATKLVINLAKWLKTK